MDIMESHAIIVHLVRVYSFGHWIFLVGCWIFHLFRAPSAFRMEPSKGNRAVNGGHPRRLTDYENAYRRRVACGAPHSGRIRFHGAGIDCWISEAGFYVRHPKMIGVGAKRMNRLLEGDLGPFVKAAPSGGAKHPLAARTVSATAWYECPKMYRAIGVIG